ncbi:hypothetical protein PJP10_30245 [Mycobacterium kansasii]
MQAPPAEEPGKSDDSPVTMQAPPAEEPGNRRRGLRSWHRAPRHVTFAPSAPAGAGDLRVCPGHEKIQSLTST